MTSDNFPFNEGLNKQSSGLFTETSIPITNFYSNYTYFYPSNYSTFHVPLNPEVYILVNGNRQKVHENLIYLENGTEFEIEIFNKDVRSIAVTLSLNGNAASKMFVIKPGQRVKLDRHIDNSKKLKFETYEIESSEDCKSATRLNGLVSLQFYSEKSQNYLHQNLNTNLFYCNSNFNGYIPVVGTTTIASMTSASSKQTINASEDQLKLNNLSETGRVESGSESEQKFTETYQQFKSYSFLTKTFTLLPKSLKPLEVKDLIRFCTDCGKKQKKEHKFCPGCGTKNL